MAKPKRSAIILFAEDIREERTGQVSVVGLHANTAGVSDFPIFIDRLAVLVDVVLPPADLPKGIQFLLKLDTNEVLAEATAPVTPPPREVDDAQLKRLSIRIHFRVKSFELKKRTELRMTVSADNVEIDSKSLLFSKAEPSKYAEIRQELPMDAADVETLASDDPAPKRKRVRAKKNA